MPSDKAAIEILPPSSTRMASMNPSPSAPSRFSSGISQSSKISSLVSLARSPSLFSFLPGRKPLVPFLHDEGRQSMRSLAFVGHGDDDRDIGIAAIGDEGLVAVQHIAVAFLHRGGARAAGIRAGAGLGERPRRQPFAARQPRNIFSLLRFVAGQKDMIRPPANCAPPTVRPIEPSTAESSSMAST